LKAAVMLGQEASRSMQLHVGWRELVMPTHAVFVDKLQVPPLHWTIDGPPSDVTVLEPLPLSPDEPDEPEEPEEPDEPEVEPEEPDEPEVEPEPASSSIEPPLLLHATDADAAPRETTMHAMKVFDEARYPRRIEFSPPGGPTAKVTPLYAVLGSTFQA
jgi:hypothetical protein